MVQEVVEEVVRRMRQRLMHLVCNQAGGEEHGDGRPDVDEDEDSATLLGENGISSVETCGVVGYHVDARYAEMQKDKLRRVNQEACRVVETMWTQDAELAWNKLDEKAYTMEKMQEINLRNKYISRK
ncbi:hypothetical protein IGI04_018681 [Brassica rapa subsp. trilocularis]|uniref:Uncharacterized protein n=1 Tax=Brassica rapa subsp. trilocularis TaxID=1813537 RepID=A0ABQ7ME38_BRACM|nr:hypothetical protein IGI04_018681 [Brassica rapa subsp. trilocularis]